MPALSLDKKWNRKEPLLAFLPSCEGRKALKGSFLNFQGGNPKNGRRSLPVLMEFPLGLFRKNILVLFQNDHNFPEPLLKVI